MDMQSGTENTPGRPLRKAMALIEVLARADRPLSLSAIARQSGQPKSSVHRVLGVLTDLNLVAPADGGFVLGDHLYDITGHGGRSPADRLRRLVNPLLLDLQERVRGVVVMGTLSGLHVQYVELLYRHELGAFVRRQPLLHPAAATATGRALLAFRPDLAGRVDELAALAGVEPEELLADLNVVRMRDVAVLTEDAAHGGTAVAAPVHVADQRPFVAIGIACPGRIDVPRTIAALRRTATVAGALAAAQQRTTARDHREP